MIGNLLYPALNSPRDSFQEVPLFPTSPLTTSQAEEQETRDDKLCPYKTDLEYLDDHFQVRATPFSPLFYHIL